MDFKLAFIGFGTVGQGLAEILIEKKEMLTEKFNFNWTIVAISDVNKGSIFNENGLDMKQIFKLLKEGKKLNIPKDWKETKNPRTIIGKYANDDLIMIVIDGRQGRWSEGVSLESLQDKLLKLGVKDAFNLDGGGSSAMYYKGKILNRPSDGQERPVVNNILIF